jgi:GntR family transcriptional regulator
MHIPRYASLATRVARELRKQLKSEYVGGGKLPSEPEIADKFGVSRGTVRQALSILEREGFILRRQGAGTFANKYVLRIKARADIAYEFTELLRIAGYEASIRPLAIERRPMGKEIAEMLEMDPESIALVVCKLFLADGQPAIYCLDYLPEAIICEPYDEAELHQPIFEFLKQRCGQTIGLNQTEIIPETADDSLAQLLEIKPGCPLLRFDEIGYNDQSGEPAIFSRIYFNDQLIRFSMLRKKV